MCAKSVSEGLLTARFYTNGWPLFTTAICQILSPKLSDVRAEWFRCLGGSSSKCVGCKLLLYSGKMPNGVLGSILGHLLGWKPACKRNLALYISLSKVTAPQDGHGGLVLQVYLQVVLSSWVT